MNLSDTDRRRLLQTAKESVASVEKLIIEAEARLASAEMRVDTELDFIARARVEHQKGKMLISKLEGTM